MVISHSLLELNYKQADLDPEDRRRSTSSTRLSSVIVRDSVEKTSELIQVEQGFSLFFLFILFRSILILLSNFILTTWKTVTYIIK